MSCSVTPKAIEFRSKLGFKQHDIILSKEQSMLIRIKQIFASKRNCYNIVSWTLELIYTFLIIN